MRFSRLAGSLSIGLVAMVQVGCVITKDHGDPPEIFGTGGSGGGGSTSTATASSTSGGPSGPFAKGTHIGRYREDGSFEMYLATFPQDCATFGELPAACDDTKWQAHMFLPAGPDVVGYGIEYLDGSARYSYPGTGDACSFAEESFWNGGLDVQSETEDRMTLELSQTHSSALGGPNTADGQYEVVICQPAF